MLTDVIDGHCNCLKFKVAKLKNVKLKSIHDPG